MLRRIFRNHYILLPGDLVVTEKNVKISTILGSCVSVCLYDKLNKIGGMNHFLLPTNNNADTEIFKYGDTSLDYLYHEMLALGADIHHITASLLGGSSMFSNKHFNYNIGRQNIDIALDFLKHKHFAIELNETGGTQGRKVAFHINTGAIDIHLLNNPKV